MFNARLIPDIEAGRPVQFTYKGQTIQGFEGESIASALMRAGIIGVRTTSRLQDPRGYYCGMGICWECAVDVSDVGAVRSCSFPVRSGLIVQEPVAMTDERP